MPSIRDFHKLCSLTSLQHHPFFEPCYTLGKCRSFLSFFLMHWFLSICWRSDLPASSTCGGGFRHNPHWSVQNKTVERFSCTLYTIICLLKSGSKSLLIINSSRPLKLQVKMSLIWVDTGIFRLVILTFFGPCFRQKCCSSSSKRS